MTNKTTDTKPTILEEAASLVNGDRERDYGHPRNNLKLIGEFWGVMLGIPAISPRAVAMMMALTKIARDKHTPKRDNLVDLAGYARAAERCDEDIIPDDSIIEEINTYLNSRTDREGFYR